MSWEKDGTVNYVNGSPVVSGSGTNWFGGLQSGWIFIGADFSLYEVLTVDSATQITLGQPYRGATANDQFYAVVPTMAMAHALMTSVQSLLANYQGVFDTIGQYRLAQGLMFQADEDTGLTNPESNAIALQAGDVLQLMLKGGVASGAAVQSDWLDANSGKLLRPGAFGWGHDASNGSANLCPGSLLSEAGISGLYRYSSQHEDAPSSAGILLHFNRVPSAASSGGRIQLAISHVGDIYTRVQSGNDPITYGDWSTGGHERDSNANGDYVRFADGTQICQSGSWSQDVDVAAGGLYRNATPVDWTFPAPFSTATGLVGYVGVTGNAQTHWGVMRTVSDTVGSITIFSHSQYSGRSFRAVAIGRWF